MLKVCAIIFSLAALLFLSAEKTLACDCLTHTAEESFKIADTVFIGPVTDVKREGKYTYYVFAARISLKGDEQIIFIRSMESDCDAKFYMGETYLVYAQEHGDYSGDYFTASSCLRTCWVPTPNKAVLAETPPKAVLNVIPPKDAAQHDYRDTAIVAGLFGLLFISIGFYVKRNKHAA